MTPLVKGDRVVMLSTECRVPQGSLGRVSGFIPRRPELACVRWDSGIELVYEQRVLAKAGAA